MTNNPTIDGVSRELLERSAYRLSDLKQCDLSEAIFTILRNPFKCSFCDDKKSVCVDWDAGEWMSCPRCSSQSDAPAVERQEPVTMKRQYLSVPGLWIECADDDPEVMTFYKQTPEVDALQSTIARLEARITQLESEARFSAATHQAARDRIAELESGQGEPVGYGTFKNGRYGSWLFRTEQSAKVHLRTANNGYPMEAEIHALYTAPPAPVAVLLPERLIYSAENIAGKNLSWTNGWNACLDATEALNGLSK